MSEITKAKARLAALTRYRPGDDEALAQARRELTAANLRQFVAETRRAQGLPPVVEDAGVLAYIATLLRLGGDADAA